MKVRTLNSADRGQQASRVGQVVPVILGISMSSGRRGWTRRPSRSLTMRMPGTKTLACYSSINLWGLASASLASRSKPTVSNRTMLLPKIETTKLLLLAKSCKSYGTYLSRSADVCARHEQSAEYRRSSHIQVYLSCVIANTSRNLAKTD